MPSTCDAREPIPAASLGCDDACVRLTHPQARPALWDIINVLERVLAALLLLACFPCLVVVLIIVGALSGRPPLIAHRRVGYRGRGLWLLKVRTMWPKRRHACFSFHCIEYLHVDSLVPESKLSADPRVTSRFAALCRRYSVDEWPQLWQVVTGDLSLVGPRPITAREFAAHYGLHSSLVLNVKPGLIGLWQVRGRNRLTYSERCKLDIFLIENWSLRLYFKILCASIPVVLSGRNCA